MAYDAFVTYSHAGDLQLARDLQYVIQSLGKRWLQRRAASVFRDDASLAASPNLWKDIEDALGKSRFLVLVASPEAAASRWVEREVQWWLGNRSPDTLLIALSAGTLSWSPDGVCFGPAASAPLPPAAARCFPAEPVWVDLRPWRDGRSSARADEEFRLRVAKLAGRIRGVPPEDLVSEERRQQRRNLRLAYSSIALLLVLLAAAGVAGTLAWTQRQEAVRRTREAVQQRKEAVRQEQEAVRQRQAAEHGYFRQREILASEYLREGRLASAVHALKPVADAGDARLSSWPRLNVIVASFEPLDRVLSRVDPWSPFTWRSRTYVRGAAPTAIHDLGTLTRPRWLRTRGLLIVFDARSHLFVFDTQRDRLVAREFKDMGFSLCHLVEDTDASLQLFGARLEGVTMGGLRVSRWKIAAERVEHAAAIDWSAEPIESSCHGNGPPPLVAEMVKDIPGLAFPGTTQESTLWSVSDARRRDAAMDPERFFSGATLPKLRGDLRDRDAKPLRRPPSARDLAQFMFQSSGGLGRDPVSVALEGSDIMYGATDASGMGGAVFGLCLKPHTGRSVGCASFDFIYTKEELGGIRFSGDGRVLIAFGRDFTVGDALGEGPPLRANLALSSASAFPEWSAPPPLNAIGGIDDVRISPSQTRLAVLAERGLYVFEGPPPHRLVREFERGAAVEIAWIGDDAVAAITRDGILRAHALEGAEPWGELALRDLSAMDPDDPAYPEGVNPDVSYWWASSEGATGLLLIGHKKHAIIVDGHLGAPITPPFSMTLGDAGFGRPVATLAPDGAVVVNTYAATYRRRGVPTGVDLRALVGDDGGWRLSDLLGTAPGPSGSR